MAIESVEHPSRVPSLTSQDRDTSWRRPSQCPRSEPLHRGGGVARTPRQRAPEFPTRADAELGEDLAEVVFDGTGADEELTADLGVRVTLDREPCDLSFLRS